MGRLWATFEGVFQGQKRYIFNFEKKNVVSALKICMYFFLEKNFFLNFFLAEKMVYCCIGDNSLCDLYIMTGINDGQNWDRVKVQPRSYPSPLCIHPCGAPTDTAGLFLYMKSANFLWTIMRLTCLIRRRIDLWFYHCLSNLVYQINIQVELFRVCKSCRLMSYRTFANSFRPWIVSAHLCSEIKGHST